MAVSGNDVYVAGYQGNNSPNARYDIATLWKNGSPVPLSDGNTYAAANSVTVSGPDVYVAGYRYPTNNTPSPTQAGYWKNGAFTALPDGGEGALAYSVLVSGTDVYVAGYRHQTTRLDPSHILGAEVAVYWKNGNLVDLTDAMDFSYGFSIAVDGPDVYVAGRRCTAPPSPGSSICTGTYWKNGTPVAVGSPAYSLVTSISVAGNQRVRECQPAGHEQSPSRVAVE